MFPGQPVTDLENYMGSLEKKQESIRTMVEKLRPMTADSANKFFGSICCAGYVVPTLHTPYKP